VGVFGFIGKGTDTLPIIF